MSNNFQPNNSFLLILSVGFFDEEDLKEFTSQLKSVLQIFFVYDESCAKYGRFSDRISKIQNDLNESDRNEYIENNEQQFEDSKLNGREFVPTVQKNQIRLKKRMDLKNRTLVTQLRAMMATRPLINQILEGYLDCEPINDKTSDSFREWLALCTRMHEINDKVMSLDGNFLCQFSLVAKAALDNSDPLSNVLIT